MPLDDVSTYSYVSLNVIVSTLITISLQWSPTEADIFASCSVDGTISIWDVRTGKKPSISVKAHKADVNVISWNRCVRVGNFIDFSSTITSAA
jgi:WD40 repeat protein